jgi:hypothetical protein
MANGFEGFIIFPTLNILMGSLFFWGNFFPLEKGRPKPWITFFFQFYDVASLAMIHS